MTSPPATLPPSNVEVIALSPRSLTTTHRYVCEVCSQGFPRSQNLQMHLATHSITPQLRAKNRPKKRVFVCPEVTCVHHHSSKALRDLTAIKKHYHRKHTEKKWSCVKCSKKWYALELDLEQHMRCCGTQGCKCDGCGKIYSSKYSLSTHRASRCHASASASVESSASQPANSLPLVPPPATSYLPQPVVPHHFPVNYPVPHFSQLSRHQWDPVPQFPSVFQPPQLPPPDTSYLPQPVVPHHFPVNYPVPHFSQLSHHQWDPVLQFPSAFQPPQLPPPVFPSAFQPLPEYPVSHLSSVPLLTGNLPAPGAFGPPQTFTQLLQSDAWFIQTGGFTGLSGEGSGGT